MTAFDVIRQVEALGGRLVIDGEDLRVRASKPLPNDVVASLRAQKAAIMIALGAPVDTTVGAILTELRPHLPPGLRNLSDDRLLALVNWSIMAAWERAILKFARP